MGAQKEVRNNLDLQQRAIVEVLKMMDSEIKYSLNHQDASVKAPKAA